MRAIGALILGLVCLAAVGCEADPWTRSARPLQSPYQHRRVVAVAPLANESGSTAVDSARLADHLSRQLEQAGRVDVLPVNRSLAAMQQLQMRSVATAEQAQQLRDAVGADILIVGVITGYDPYDPPKLGLAIESYIDPKSEPNYRVNPLEAGSTVSAFYDAADPHVRDELIRYSGRRSAYGKDPAWQRYRISMDLYSEFVAYMAAHALLDREANRIAIEENAYQARLRAQREARAAAERERGHGATLDRFGDSHYPDATSPTESEPTPQPGRPTEQTEGDQTEGGPA